MLISNNRHTIWKVGSQAASEPRRGHYDIPGLTHSNSANKMKYLRGANLTFFLSTKMHIFVNYIAGLTSIVICHA